MATTMDMSAVLTAIETLSKEVKREGEGTFGKQRIQPQAERISQTPRVPGAC